MTKVLVLGGCGGEITQLIKNILRDAEMLANEPKPNVHILGCDHGWYRKFEKTNKRKNFTKG